MKGIETLNWNDGEIDVHFSFSKGYPARLSGDPDTWEPACDDEFELEAIVYKGVNVTELFSDYDLGLIESEILEMNNEDI